MCATKLLAGPASNEVFRSILVHYCDNAVHMSKLEGKVRAGGNQSAFHLHLLNEVYTPLQPPTEGELRCSSLAGGNTSFSPPLNVFLGSALGQLFSMLTQNATCYIYLEVDFYLVEC